jgi:DNA-binding response OmpR family regulator
MTKNSILLIDDESDITFTIKSILENNGFKVDSFTDPISVLDNYQINFYDLILY